MDMFSIGCVLAELFSEDAPNGNLFDLGNLLAYRVTQFYPEKSLNSIANNDIKDLVKNLISLEPKERILTSEILAQLKDKVFPTYFETLYDYLTSLVRLPPDAKIIRLAQDIDGLLPSILQQEPHGLLLLLVVITSTMRGLKHIHCKILAQRLSCKIANSSPVMSTFITDRLLPYLLQTLSDTDARVRAESINSITTSLEKVIELPQSDNNVFTDYILPVLVSFLKILINQIINNLFKTSVKWFLIVQCL
jgi:serine/threonine protein kinase